MNPYFDSLAALWSMDGHGPYVWISYAVAVAIVLLLLLWPWWRERRLQAQLRRRLGRQPATVNPGTSPTSEEEASCTR